jgi:hypothetical protein
VVLKWPVKAVHISKSKHSNIATEEVDRIDRIFQDWLIAVDVSASLILNNLVNPV